MRLFHQMTVMPKKHLDSDAGSDAAAASSQNENEPFCLVGGGDRDCLSVDDDSCEQFAASVFGTFSESKATFDDEAFREQKAASDDEAFREHEAASAGSDSSERSTIPGRTAVAETAALGTWLIAGWLVFFIGVLLSSTVLMMSIESPMDVLRAQEMASSEDHQLSDALKNLPVRHEKHKIVHSQTHNKHKD